MKKSLYLLAFTDGIHNVNFTLKNPVERSKNPTEKFETICVGPALLDKLENDEFVWSAHSNFRGALKLRISNSPL